MKKPFLKPAKSELITTLQTLLQSGFFQTQEEICAALEKQGFQLNQAMVSRVLHKVGAIKIVEEGSVVYRLPTESVSVTSKDSLHQLVLDISHNESLIVVRTVPGSAQLVARLLDQPKKMGILGTVAGDDTIFVAPENTKKMQQILANVTRVLLG
jgi:transcriptional regulator of arginine metabolism